MYTESILWMLSWPVLLIVTYQVIKLVLKKYNSKMENQEEDPE